MLLKKANDEVNLHQAVLDKMSELRVDFITLCRIAHVREFGTDPDQNQSYINWKQHGLIPSYVQKFLT